MSRSTLLALVALACSPQPSPTTGPATSPSPAPVESTSVPSSELSLTPNPAVLSFSELPSLRFRSGAPLRLQPIAKEARITALAPDAKSWLLELANDSKLVTPARPDGVRVDAWNSSAIFSADGRYVAVWNYQGSFAVLEVPSGKLRVEKDVSTCAVRFSGPDEIVFHTASKEHKGRLFRLSLTGGQAVASGAPRSAETCHVSIDGSRWLIDSYDERWFVDGKTGRGLRLPPDGSLPSSGHRLCTGNDAGLSCVRYPDGAVEKIWARPSSDEYSVHDPSGKRALFRYADDPDGVHDGYAFVDFEARTVQRLENVKWFSGSMLSLTHGGTLLTVGSGHGLYVYDIERGQKRLAPHRPLYGNFTFPHHSRTLVAGTDEPMDLFLIQVP